MSDLPVLFDYWRSSAAYRVRIALNLAGIAYQAVAVDIANDGQLSDENRARNPQGKVPTLAIDGLLLTQSLAMIHYLADTRGLQILPDDAAARARVTSLAHVIAMDIHPVCNTGVVFYIETLTQGGDQFLRDWMQKYIGSGLKAFQELLVDRPAGRCCFGDVPLLADMCLVPQLFNARRWDVDLEPLGLLVEIDAHLKTLEPFRLAHPEVVGAP